MVIELTDKTKINLKGEKHNVLVNKRKEGLLLWRQGIEKAVGSREMEDEGWQNGEV